MIKSFITTVSSFIAGIAAPDVLSHELTADVIQCLQGIAFLVTIIAGIFTIIFYCKRLKNKKNGNLS